MNINYKFKPGDSIYLVNRYNFKSSSRYYIVDKVGRKYITVVNPPYSNFKLDKDTLKSVDSNGSDCFVGYIDENTYLYETYINSIKQDIRKAIERGYLDKVTDIDKLIAIAQIINYEIQRPST